jgi:hypothetical protein
MPYVSVRLSDLMCILWVNNNYLFRDCKYTELHYRVLGPYA